MRFTRWILCGALSAVYAFGAATTGGVGLQPGSLPAGWRSGGPSCVTVPDWQVHEYNEDFYILRESGCIHFEKPFLYLIFGAQHALLEDTGAGDVQTAPFVASLLAKWAKKKGRAVPGLIVIHSHGHGDHVAADQLFQRMPHVRFIAATPEGVQKAAGITRWPQDIGEIDLGERTIDVIPIPGHHAASIALYDRLTGNLLTGDSLYPGRLSVSLADIPVFVASAARLVDFVRTHNIAHVLGTHIEQTRTPYLDYPRGTVYQPEEHALELTRAHVIELSDALTKMSDSPMTVALPEFTILVRTPPPSRGARK